MAWTRIEYRCTVCGVVLVVGEGENDPGMTVCSECGGKVRRVFAADG